MKLRVCEVETFEREVALRLPFRFGVVTLREAPQMFLRVRVESQNGKSEWGCAAEILAPKWFDKNPELGNEENFEQLRQSIRQAARLYTSEPAVCRAFDLFARHYQQQIEECAGQSLNSLIACFGPALLDRAVLDAACRLKRISYHEAIRNNLPGIRQDPLFPDLKAFDFDSFLAELSPRHRLHARHTIGLLDPLRRDETSPSERIGDGLPESLEEAIQVYGHRYFKVKVIGDLEQDLPRLRSIAEVLDQTTPGDYFVTLDGNEQYDSINGVNQMLATIAAETALAQLSGRILFVEQPINRSLALNTDLSPLESELPVIIDESDDSLDAFPLARRCGYVGVSSKACKGFYKSLINLARCKVWNRTSPRHFFMSGEDLSVQPGISLQQDLAIVALLGVEHVERNGHHYVNGMAGASPREQQAFLSAHPDLYQPTNGGLRLKIQGGEMEFESLHCPGFATAAEPDWKSLKQVW